MKSKEEIARKFKKNKQTSDSLLGKQYSNTRKSQAFYAGDFMRYEDRIQFRDSDGKKKRALVQFNKVKPYVNAVAGFFVQNRSKPKYLARLEQAQVGNLYSKYANALSDYIRDEANADQVETQADKDLLICGYSAVETAISYQEGHLSDNVNGKVIMGRIDPLTAFWDPYARESNLLDKRWCGVTKQFSLDDALELFDDQKEEDFESADDNEQNKGDMQYFQDGGVYDKVVYDWYNESEKMVNVHFYQWYDIEKYYRAENPLNNLNNPEARELARQQLDDIAAELDNEDGDLTPESVFDPRAEIINFDEKTKARLLDIFGEFIDPKELKVKRYYTAVISGEKVFTAYQSPSQKGYSLKFKTGDFDERNKIWTGIVNSLMEPVLYYNKALTELMFIIGANSKGGVMFEEGAVDDVVEFEAKYARTDASIMVNDGALTNGRIQEKKSPSIPTGYESIIGLSDAALNDVSGIDKTFLGSSENKLETAQLQRQRVRQIVSSMATYVDNILLYQKEHARLMLDYMRIYAENNRGSLFPILGEDGVQQFIDISEDKLSLNFVVMIEEAPETKEEKQEYVGILTTIGDKLTAIGDPSGKLVYSIAVKYMPIDKEDQLKLTEILVPNKEEVDPQYVQQLEKQIQELTGEMNRAQVEKVISDISLNEAKTIQTRADAQKKAAETAETLEDTTQKELENEFIKRNINNEDATLNVNV